MHRDIEIRIPPEQADDKLVLQKAAARKIGVSPSRITAVVPIRRSIDARKRPIVFMFRVRVWVDEPPAPEAPLRLDLPEVTNGDPVVIVGAGPAGLFAALRLIEGGLRPILLERGKAVRPRRFDIARLARGGQVDPESNYCFGEGGAGTFSDGKLYTRAKKRGQPQRILEMLVLHGASPDILVDAHPHIGTNRLPAVVEALRETIINHGGEIHFGARVTELERTGDAIRGVRLADGRSVDGLAVILATGHSARDVYQLLHEADIAIEAKPLAIGVRVEHPQALIDSIQYKSPQRPKALPPASYSVLKRVGERGIYSFCMCPGGIICPAMTAPGEVVVNGWSPSKRNSRWANSGVVVEVGPGDFAPFQTWGPLAAMALQADIETKAGAAGGGNAAAPAQRLIDFISGQDSPTLPDCSYPPGIVAGDVAALFPADIGMTLREGLREFGNAMRGYLSDDAVVVGVETRSSAPVRIPRDKDTLMHPGAPGLYPCGEGGGHAGGIVSAAMDGRAVAEAILGARPQTRPK
ncbi:MAG: putative FAD-dependent dehydrogenase [Hyphomicrobiaceae bacterium]|jgi:uncharacterized FAD-dependent dehydrogenase